MSSFGRDEGRTLPPSVDAFINMRDLVVGDNDWYNVTPSVRRAIEGFALILRDHEARLMNGGGESIGSPIGRTSSSAAEVTSLKERIARLEEELAVTKRRVAEVTNVAVTAASDAKGAVIESHSIRPDVDRLQHGLSSLHTAVGAHLKDIRGKVANAGSNPGTPTAGMNGESPGVDDLRRRVRDLEGDVERFFNEEVTGRPGGPRAASRVASPPWRITRRPSNDERSGWSAWWTTCGRRRTGARGRRRRSGCGSFGSGVVAKRRRG